MLKHLTTCTILMALATPAFAQQSLLVEDVFNIYQPTGTSLILYVPVGDDELQAWKLTDITAVEGLARCNETALKAAVTSQMGAASALPEKGFSTIRQYLGFLKKEKLWSGVGDIPSPSGRFFGCPVGVKNAHYGVWCADSFARDGHIEYDTCIPSKREEIELDAAVVRGGDAAGNTP